MRKRKKDTVPAVVQMLLDFGFAETVAAVDRIQADAEQGETDVYVHNDREGNKNVEARSTTAGRGQENTAGIDAGSGLSTPVHGPGLQNSGPLGDELASSVSEPGAGRGVDAPGALADQQLAEEQILLTQEALEALASGTTENEGLQQFELKTEL